MKILLDTCVWGGVVQELQAAGHDVAWAGDWQEDPGDDEILERALPRPGLWTWGEKALTFWDSISTR
jgi:hypothetical protein